MYSIRVVAKESGIAAATLRKWEERYGFPNPLRTPKGTRVYSEEDLNALKRIKVQLDLGGKPSKLLTDPNLLNVSQSSKPVRPSIPGPTQKIYEHLKAAEIFECYALLEDYKNSLSTRDFIEQICAPLTKLVGDGWACGDISVHAEHCFSEQLHALLTIGQRRSYEPNAPTAVLATLSNELHTLGLKMAHAALNDLGCRSIYAGANLPISEILMLAQVHDANLVGISITTNTSSKTITEQINVLRKQLPSDVTLLLGGSGCAYLSSIPEKTEIISDISQLYEGTVLK